MDMETDGDDRNFSTIVKAKVAVGGTIYSTISKADENQLRAAVVDKLPEILEALREEQIKLAERRAIGTG